ncbi:hypothetical protein, partial [Polaromonas sp.]|uniref:hypothetical protein n=1 Tax=Polaromonas sp. TaxID=1869339 RepID=UPI00286A06E9
RVRPNMLQANRVSGIGLAVLGAVRRDAGELAGWWFQLPILELLRMIPNNMEKKFDKKPRKPGFQGH